MSYKVILDKSKGDGNFFTFPSMSMEIGAELVVRAEIKKALQTLAALIVKHHPQHQTVDGLHDAIGIEFHSLEFHFILDPQKAKEQKVADKLMGVNE